MIDGGRLNSKYIEPVESRPISERSNVDTVIIGGRVRKYQGKVVGLDISRLKAMIEESRGHLFTAVGYRPDIFAELLPKLS